jgi:predicted kinase
MNKPILYLIRGLPGSGKSTMAQLLCNKYGGEIVEADHWFMENGRYNFNPSELPKAHSMCKLRTEHVLRNGINVFVANTFTTLSEIDPYFDIASEIKVKTVVIECKGNFGSVHNVPQETIEKMRLRWEHLMP